MSKTQYNVGDDFQVSASLGLLEGVTGVADYAQQNNVPTSAAEVVGHGGQFPVLPSDAGETIELVSTDAGNASAIIEIEVLDENFEMRKTAPIEIAGPGTYQVLDDETLQPVLVSRINGAVNVGPRGTGEVVADIVIRDTTTQTKIFATLTAQSQEVQQAIRTIPAGHIAVITSLTTSMTKTQGSDGILSLRLFGGKAGNVFRQVFAFGLQRSGDSSIEFQDLSISKSTGPVDLYLTAVASDAGVDVSARLTATLVKI